MHVTTGKTQSYKYLEFRKRKTITFRKGIFLGRKCIHAPHKCRYVFNALRYMFSHIKFNIYFF